MHPRALGHVRSGVQVIELDPSQRAAVELALSARLAIITGGPGTGKTTSLRTTLDELDRQGKRYQLAAPTGKAARRMHEATGRPAQTIHRLLEWRGTWQRHRLRPLSTDAVLIDESSMIDIELLAALLDAINSNVTRLVLIGDADQLPPVGPGRPFADLVASGLVPVARLTRVHRSAAESWICANAPRVLAGEMPSLVDQHGFRWVHTDSASDLLPRVHRLLVDYVPKHVNADTQVLIPQNNGVAGIAAANTLLQQALNPRGPKAPYMRNSDSVELRVGDRVIQTRNDYMLGVFNGEVGEVIDIQSGQVQVHLDGRPEPVVYTLEQAHSLRHAYALTVHRAQGSEFPWVIMVCHSTHHHMLTRQLLYTGITRGKQGVILVGDVKGVRRAVEQNRPSERQTTLVERIKGTLT